MGRAAVRTDAYIQAATPERAARPALRAPRDRGVAALSWLRGLWAFIDDRAGTWR